jgi:hypothetical protein
MFRCVNAAMRAVLWLALMAALAGCNLGTNANTPTPAATSDQPRVAFLNLINDSSIYEGAALELDILATDPQDGGGIARIELRIDDMLIQTADNPQPSAEYRVLLSWPAQGVGIHFVTATAYRADGTPSEEARILIRVVGPPSATP